VDKHSKIYLAGHTGMVGSAIYRRLQALGYKNFVCRTAQELDLTDQQATAAFFQQQKPMYVILAAARVGGIVANNTYRAQFIYENLQIQNNIIHQAWLHGVKKLLFLGSSCIYPKLAPQPISEEHLLTGVLEYTNEPYAIAKIAGLKMCEAYNMQYGTDFISVMPTNLYGPNDNYDLEKSHVLPALIRKMHLGKCLEQADWDAIRKDLSKRPVEGVDGTAPESAILEKLDKYGIMNIKAVAGPDHGKNNLTSSQQHPVTLHLWGSGNPLREFMHVDDLAAACVFLMENISARDLSSLSLDPPASPPQAVTSSPFINLGTGTDQSIRDLAALVKKVVGFSGEILWDSSKPDGTPRKLLDVSRMKSLGFEPQISLEEGITRTYGELLK
jgi:GDP-L-fucose synthase